MTTLAEPTTHSTIKHLPLAKGFQFMVRWVPSALLVIAAVLLVQSIDKPYWNMHLDAPQYDYRNGLDVIVYIDRMEGKDPKFDELRELNSLNHYIGMRNLDEAATLERSIAIQAMYTFAALLGISAVLLAWRGRGRRWTSLGWLLMLPALSFPFVFIADLAYWLRDSGQNLDPTAPFSSSIHPFTPPVWGEGTVGQFHTIASLDSGWEQASTAAALMLVAVAVMLLGYIVYRWQQRKVIHA
ncbi:MAG: cytochrome C [Anaerolineales bacterium]|nr:cytochrome C [Anaerolineales bacterium]